MFKERTIYQKVREHLNKKEYTIVTGARQTGKTTLISALFRELKKESGRVYYLTFENADVLRDINESPEKIFKYAARPDDPLTNGSAGERITLFIDEIQYADNPSNFLKYLYDKYLENLKIVATGSSAFYIDSKFTDSLAGRKRIFNLQTLSFEEYLTFVGRDDLQSILRQMRSQPDFLSTQKEEMLQVFDEYLIYGGYPAAALEPEKPEKLEILKELKNSFLKRDIDESGVSSPDLFYKLCAILAGQVGNLVNRNELSNTVGVDNKTIDRYLTILQKCFHINLVKPFSGNLRKELTKMPKIYFYDNGMLNALSNRFFPLDVREDKGQLIENYVFKRLSEKFDDDDIRFWRTTDQKEVDFVVNGAFERSAYEVKFNCTTKRSKGIKQFAETYPQFNFMTVSHDFHEGCLQAQKL